MRCFLLQQLQTRHSSAHGQSESIEELRNAFDLVEKSSPGLADDLVTELATRLAQYTISDRELDEAVDKVKGYYSRVDHPTGPVHTQ